MPGKKIGGHRACFLTKCCERWIICAVGTGARYKITPIVLEVSSKYALEIKLVFGCFYVFDIANTEI